MRALSRVIALFLPYLINVDLQGIEFTHDILAGS